MSAPALDYRRHLHTRVDPRTGAPVWPLRIVENRLTPSAGLTAGESEHRLSSEWLLNARAGYAAGSRSNDGSDALSPAASDAPPRQARDAAIEAGASLTGSDA